MPLTLGYYTRQDLPFNYAMADAFTICDQNFCSGMTSTTPNRSFFWTGKITNEENGLPKANIRNDDFSYGKLNWGTFPELLEQHHIPWKFYQNDISCGGGFKGEERSWLANFGCNLLEFFAPYQVKFSSRYVQGLQKLVDTLPEEINKLQEASPSSEEAAQKIKNDIAKKQEALDNATTELSKWNKSNFDQLFAKEKSLHQRAFTINSGDPSFRSVTQLTYRDGNEQREVTVPKGDILHQFRKDVHESKPPAASWLAGPQNFSHHPSAPSYGAWDVTEILDILTGNPEVWKKTIFIVTYDENDGYFDHIPPFSIPDNNKPGTGKCTAGIETEVEHVRLANELKQGITKKQAREAPIGLGFRVPMIIASPWSRGGKVCSQLFDHTSTLQFLETFLRQKFGKDIRTDNISQWRRTICGDLTSAFSPFDGKKPGNMPFLHRDKYVQDIYNAKFRQDPSGFQQLTESQLGALRKGIPPQGLMAGQEKGIRPSCALPYELHADGKWNAGTGSFEIRMATGKRSAGSPFTVYAPVPFREENGAAEISRNWSFAVGAGDALTYAWPGISFVKGDYQLHLHGPNGFHRAFRGNSHDPSLEIGCTYDPAGNIVLQLNNTGTANLDVQIDDKAYGHKSLSKTIPRNGKDVITIPLGRSYGWYDFSIRVKGAAHFEQRYAGRVETGKESFTDPFMGRA